jgi:hypothetical protein
VLKHAERTICAGPLSTTAVQLPRPRAPGSAATHVPSKDFGIGRDERTVHVERNLCWRSNPMLRLPLPAASSESSRLPCDCRRSWPTSCAVAWPLSSYRSDFPENYKRTWAICCTRRSIKVMPRRRGPAETNRDPARLYTHAHTVLVSARRTKKPRRSGAKLVLIRRSPTEPLCAVGNPPIEYHIRLHQCSKYEKAPPKRG